VKKLYWLCGIMLPLVFSPSSRAQYVVDAPKPQASGGRVMDRPFLFLMAVEAAAKSADFITTTQVIGRSCGQNCTVTESDPWFGQMPSTGRVIGENLLIFSAEVALSYELKRPHHWLPGDRYIRKFWCLPIAWQIQGHIRNTVWNLN
jgi:hypothetical protein